MPNTLGKTSHQYCQFTSMETKTSSFSENDTWFN